MPIIEHLFPKYTATAIVTKNNVTINMGDHEDMLQWVVLCDIDFDEIRIYYPHSYIADEVIIAVQNEKARMLINITTKTFVQVPTI